MNLDYRIALLCDHIRYDEDRPLKIGEQSHRDEVAQLIRDVVAEITPERATTNYETAVKQRAQGYNDAIDQIELNLKKILDNDKD